MYKAVVQTLLELSSAPKYLGAQIGFFSLLHTWAQDLHYHSHIHTVILAGGLTKKNQWRNSSQKFFIPVKVAAKTFSGPLAVVKSLGRYTHRVAISNSRIVDIDEKTVSFTVKDRKHGNLKKTLTLTGIEFVRRFLMHVLPKGFVKIRHYGLLANRNKKTKLELSRKLTRSPAYSAKLEGLNTTEILSVCQKRFRTA